MLKLNPTPPVEQLLKKYTYDPETGVLTTNRTGLPVRKHNGKGYRSMRIDGIHYRAARIIWKMMTGREPAEIIDHINGNHSDDRWCNIREATYRQNAQNCRCQRNSKSGLKGVSADLKGRWNATIRIDGISTYLGKFSTAEEAHEAYKSAALKHFGEFARF